MTDTPLYGPTADLIESQIGTPCARPDDLRRTAIEALRALDEHRLIRRIRHLEGRIASQRGHVASLIADRRYVKERARGWWEGREALLKGQLQSERTINAELDRKLRVAEAALAALEPRDPA